MPFEGNGGSSAGRTTPPATLEQELAPGAGASATTDNLRIVDRTRQSVLVVQTVGPVLATIQPQIRQNRVFRDLPPIVLAGLNLPAQGVYYHCGRDFRVIVTAPAQNGATVIVDVSSAAGA